MSQQEPLRVTILAEDDPLVFVRVLHLIGGLNLVPRRASAELQADRTIRIALELPEHERLHVELFRKRVLAIPTVIAIDPSECTPIGVEPRQ